MFVCLSRTAVEGINAINKKEREERENYKKKEKQDVSFNIYMFIETFVILDLMCPSPIIDLPRGGKSV